MAILLLQRLQVLPLHSQKEGCSLARREEWPHCATDTFLTLFILKWSRRSQFTMLGNRVHFYCFGKKDTNPDPHLVSSGEHVARFRSAVRLRWKRVVSQ